MHEQSPAQIAKQMAVDTQFDDFKERLSIINSKKYQANQDRINLAAHIRQLISSRQDLFDMFQNAAQTKYPELHGKAAWKMVSSLNPGHQLLCIWDEYAKKIAQFDKAIAASFVQYNSAIADEAVAIKEEGQVRSAYRSYQAKHPEKPEQLILPETIVIEESVSQEHDAGIFGDVSALDVVDSEARAMIQAELSNSDYDVSPSSASLAPQSQEIPKWVKWGAVAAAAYYFLT